MDWYPVCCVIELILFAIVMILFGIEGDLIRFEHKIENTIRKAISAVRNRLRKTPVTE